MFWEERDLRIAGYPRGAFMKQRLSARRRKFLALVFNRGECAMQYLWMARNVMR